MAESSSQRDESYTRTELRRTLCDQTDAIRQRRRTVEYKMLRNRRVWMDIEIQTRYQSEGGNRSIPSARRVMERTNTRCTEMIMPNVAKHFDITPTVQISQQNLPNVEAWMRYVYRKKIATRSNVSQLVRCCLLYGRPILKTSIRVFNNKVWPIQRVVDPFAYYTFPETASTPEEKELEFEDYLFSYEKYAALQAKNPYLEYIAIGDLTKPDWPYHLVERLSYQGISDPTANVYNQIDRTSSDLQRTSSAFVALTEIWIRREDKLYQVYIARNLKNGPRLVGFVRSPYDEPLIRSTIHRPLPGETYTNAQMEDIVGLDALQNEQVNKFQDAVDWEQGFMMMASTQRHDSWKMKGRSLWLTSDDPRTQGLFVQPPSTSVGQLRAWQIYLQLMNSMGGAGTIAEGQPGRNMPRAGFAVNTLVNLGMADVQDIAKLLESEVLTPGLSDVHSTVQFIPDTQMMLIPGAQTSWGGQQSSIVKKENLNGAYDFEWIGSEQYQDESQRAERVMTFLQLVSNPVILQSLMQSGIQPNFRELLQMTWRYVLGERSLDKIFTPLQQQPLPTQAVGGPAQPATPPPQSPGAQPQGRPSPPPTPTPPSLPIMNGARR